MSSHLRNFIDVTRLNKPIGYFLLFWPCACGLSLAYYFDKDINIFLFHLTLFFSGSILMRSAGCIVNDIVDEKIDKKVSRTKKRPIASGSLDKKLAWLYVLILCLLAFIILIQFNFLTICLGIFSMVFAFSYPFMKRFTYWPQLFLGFTFNWGSVMAWTSIMNDIDYLPIIFYIGAIFWTLGYDTIYGFQDIKDDEIIGVKSTSIKFKKNPKIFIFISYLILSISLVMVGIIMNFSKIYFLSLLIPFFHLYYYQVYKFEKNNSEKCLNIFKSNNLLGLIIFINLLIGKIT